MDYCIFVKVTAKGQNVSVCPDDTFDTTKYFISKLGIVMHHCESECHAKSSPDVILCGLLG